VVSYLLQEGLPVVLSLAEVLRLQPLKLTRLVDLLPKEFCSLHLLKLHPDLLELGRQKNPGLI
jgi:hypothetical protein